MDPELELLLTFLLPVLLLGLVFLFMCIWVITRGMSRSEKVTNRAAQTGSRADGAYFL